VWVIDSKSFLSLLTEHDRYAVIAPFLNSSFNKSYITYLSKQLRENNNALRAIKTKISPEGVNVAFFDTKSYMKEYFEKLNAQGYNFNIHWFKEKLNSSTASLAAGKQVVCCFVNDIIDAATVEKLNEEGIKMIAMRCAGKILREK
jgi:D-lactate dehydrogenase